MSADCLVRIGQALPLLRPAETRVAEAVLADPTGVVGSTITELSNRAGASQASVVRFCRALGYTGYPEFRIDLAQSASRQAMELERSGIAQGEINRTDTVKDVISKIAFHESRTIEETARTLDADALEKCVDALVIADRIDIFGVGSSALTGQDLAQKLQRIGLICFAFPDTHSQIQSAALTGAGNVAIAISHSGSTSDTVYALNQAKQAGATAVAITNFPESPLTQYADLTLATSARETRFRSGAMSSRIAQLAIIDFLFVRVAQRRFDQSNAALLSTYRALHSRTTDRSRKT